MAEKKKKELGRPRIAKTKEELQEKIDSYFIEKCQDITKIVDGKPVTKPQPPTISGLALHIGFVNRESLYNYMEEGHDYCYTVKKAVARIENYAEQQLFCGQATGAIFWLKNRGWKDKQQVEFEDVTESELEKGRQRVARAKKNEEE